MVALASIDHIRRPTLNPRYRAELYQRLTDLAQLLHDHDRSAVVWAEQRRRIFDEMQRTHDLLWDIDCFNGRQPPRPGEPPLPPTSEDPIYLYGRRLRTTCLAILARHGCQSLPELHTLVHLYGYAVARTGHRERPSRMRWRWRCGKVERGVPTAVTTRSPGGTGRCAAGGRLRRRCCTRSTRCSSGTRSGGGPRRRTTAGRTRRQAEADLAARNPASRSARMSSIDSSPTDKRTSSGLTPDDSCSSAESWL